MVNFAGWYKEGYEEEKNGYEGKRGAAWEVSLFNNDVWFETVGYEGDS